MSGINTMLIKKICILNSKAYFSSPLTIKKPLSEKKY